MNPKHTNISSNQHQQQTRLLTVATTKELTFLGVWHFLKLISLSKKSKRDPTIEVVCIHINIYRDILWFIVFLILMTVQVTISNLAPYSFGVGLGARSESSVPSDNFTAAQPRQVQRWDETSCGEGRCDGLDVKQHTPRKINMVHLRIDPGRGKSSSKPSFFRFYVNQRGCTVSILIPQKLAIFRTQRLLYRFIHPSIGGSNDP